LATIEQLQQLQRAHLLLKQDRAELALQEFGKLAAECPNDPQVLLGMALCHVHLGNLVPAQEAVAQAIAADPDKAEAHVIMARVLTARNLFAEAEQAVDRAIELDPASVDAYGCLASIKLEQRQWAKAEHAARIGLEIDPHDDGLKSLLGFALQSQGKHEESFQELNETLAQNPENATALALLGWAQLRDGDNQLALETFQESLRMEPGNQAAREGLMTALKSQYALYHWLMKWFYWMDQFSGQAQFAVMIGMFVAIRVLRSMAQANPVLGMFIYPIVVIYIFFAAFTWWGDAIFDLVLRSSRYGRNAITDDERVHSNWMALLFGLMFTGALVWLAGVVSNTPDVADAGMRGLIMFGVTALPMSVRPKCQPGWPYITATVMVIGFALLALVHIPGSIALLIFHEGPLRDLATLGSIGVFLLSALGGFITQFVLVWLVRARPQQDFIPR